MNRVGTIYYGKEDITTKISFGSEMDKVNIQILRQGPWFDNMTFHTASGEIIPEVPRGIRILDLDTNEYVPSVGGAYSIAWMGSYHIERDSKVVLKIINERQQTLFRIE
jgi:hypothetical protein